MWTSQPQGGIQNNKGTTQLEKNTKKVFISDMDFNNFNNLKFKHVS